MARIDARSRFEETVQINTGDGILRGTLAIPEQARSAVVFAHGSGSSRHSPRNLRVAQSLHDVGLATLLVDLLTASEERIDAFSGQHRFDIELLTTRLLAATDWLAVNCTHHAFRIGYFGASTGAAAALQAAARHGDIAAVVSRGGRPDLAGDELDRVRSATLLIVGGFDAPVIELNRAAYQKLAQAVHKDLVIIPGAGHLFEEPGKLDEVARLAGDWFVRFLETADQEA